MFTKATLEKYWDLGKDTTGEAMDDFEQLLRDFPALAWLPCIHDHYKRARTKEEFVKTYGKFQREMSRANH